jgi:hypothetical protein
MAELEEENENTSHLRRWTNIEWDCKNEMTEVVNHPRLACSRALDDGDCVGVGFSTVHFIEHIVQIFMEFATIGLRPCG